jgi:hypothetical protein
MQTRLTRSDIPPHLASKLGVHALRSVNPARTFGAAAVAGTWRDHV